MHIKTNVEHSPVQIIVLAMCPLIFAVSNVSEAIFFLCGTILCLIISQLFLMIFNRYLANDVKALLTAIISAMLVAVATVAVREYTDKVLPDNSYLIIFSTTILNAEFIYFSSKALKRHYFLNILKNLVIFALMMLVYSVFKEFLAIGTVCEKQLFKKFDGFVFCESIIFELLWIATLCALFDYTVRYIDKKRETKNMIYQKYVRIIRNEKAFQYDRLRREKLLANQIEVNRINKSDSEKIKQKEAENEAIESVQEVVSEEEVIEVTGVDAETVDTETDAGAEGGASDETPIEDTGKKSKKKKKKEDKK